MLEHKQMFTKGFLFVLKDSQSSMKFLKGFSCSKIVMFTVEDSSKFITRHGSVIAMLLVPPTATYYRNSYYTSRWPAILQTRTTQQPLCERERQTDKLLQQQPLIQPDEQPRMLQHKNVDKKKS